MSDLSYASIAAKCEGMLLGKLGTELALVYHDTLQSPLPPRLQALIDRLEAESLGRGWDEELGDRA